MSEHCDVFRCDYCGQLTDLNDGVIHWTPSHELDNGDQVYVPSVYCSHYCGEKCTSAAGSGRG